MTIIAMQDRFDDNTRIGTYKDCPRRFFLRHVLHWRSDGTAITLAFGQAWHSAMDVVWTYAKVAPQDELPDLAMAKFYETWEEQGFQSDLDTDQIRALEPRTPGIAHEMLAQYTNNRWNMLQSATLIQAEQPFAVPLPNLNHSWYVGRLDKVIEYNGNTIALEHKTTALYSKTSGFQPNYIEGWFTDAQVKGYIFGGGLWYPGLKQVWVDAALVHKTRHDEFRFIPIAHSFDIIKEFLDDAEEWVTRMTRDEDWWNREGQLLPGMFPKNENQCQGKYGNCAFIDVCRTQSPKSYHKDTVPPHGYIVEEWKPFETLGLEKIIGQEVPSV